MESKRFFFHGSIGARNQWTSILRCCPSSKNSSRTLASLRFSRGWFLSFEWIALELAPVFLFMHLRKGYMLQFVENIFHCTTVDGSEIRWYGKYPIIYDGVLIVHPNGGWEWDFWSINSVGLVVNVAFCHGLVPCQHKSPNAVPKTPDLVCVSALGGEPMLGF